jgi:peptidoglycan hydrolase-like protein with peptidoglycan-binding domain
MEHAIKVRAGVGPDLPNRPEDLAATAAGLVALGQYVPDADFLSGSFPRSLQSAISRFQRGRGLTEDGKLFPGGPTEAALNSALASQPDAARAAVLRLDGDVGDGLTNAGEDVAQVQTALREIGLLNPDDGSKAHGFIDAPTDAAIRDFQATAGLKEDGIVRPHGPTERALRHALALPTTERALRRRIELSLDDEAGRFQRTRDDKPETDDGSEIVPAQFKLDHQFRTRRRAGSGLPPNWPFAQPGSTSWLIRQFLQRQYPTLFFKELHPSFDKAAGPNNTWPHPIETFPSDDFNDYAKDAEPKRGDRPKPPSTGRRPGGADIAKNGRPGTRDDYIEILPSQSGGLIENFIVRRKGSEDTRRQNHKIVKLFTSWAKDSGCKLTHIGGSRRVDKEHYGEELEETYLRPRDRVKRRRDEIWKRRKGASYPDITFKHEGSKRRLLVNTYTRNARLDPTRTELGNAVKMLFNAEKGDIILLIPKLAKGEAWDLDAMKRTFLRLCKIVGSDMDEDAPDPRDERSVKRLIRKFKKVVRENK